MATRKLVGISAISLYTGGSLTVARDFLRSLVEYVGASEVTIVFFCHNQSLFSQISDPRIHFFEVPSARGNWLTRIFWEYLGFAAWSAIRKVDVWISLHDVTPNVFARRRFVYCHNPSPFYTGSPVWQTEPTLEVFRRFYSLLYKLNASKNEAMIVQQHWFRDKLSEITGVSPSKIIVSRPVAGYPDGYAAIAHKPADETVLFYPAVPRVFKNFEVLLQAVEKVEHARETKFRVILSIDGNENKYARYIVRKYKHLASVSFVGYLNPGLVNQYYQAATALVFPSLLETWGLPLSEFRATGKPIIAANLPYAREVLADYPRACFFDPQSSEQLSALLMRLASGDDLPYEKVSGLSISPYARNWRELQELLSI